MLLNEIYTNVNTQLSKDGNTGYLPMNRFNTLLPSVLYELIRDEAKINSVLLENGNEELLSLRVLQDLIIIQENIAVSAIGGQSNTAIVALEGGTPLTDDMLYWGKMWCERLNGAQRKIKLVTFKEFGDRFSNMMKMNLDENPVAIIQERSGVSYARIFPSSVYGIQVGFMYIKKPTDPFLDYYMNSSYKTIYLAEDGSHTLTTGEQYRDGTTSGLKSSVTQELEIPEDYHPKFQDMLIARLSLPIDDRYKNQYATAKEQK